ncbi:hypothetical protein [Curtobacterium flaccumfaciens]|uniref:hypothetical protein n=1 Tax=Curtobacterium flaccumfaciens TaxID=2035 RepID=UPI00159A4100|nr:hypothetical protein [Curtobacterium flaccumfaciens]QKS88617.1 hypothetical protein FK523_14495 [Curtobacterium flaccumfaciens pv. flaccumfaciens]
MAAIVTMSLLTACAGGKPMESPSTNHAVKPDAAKRTVVDLVDETARAVDGGPWKVISGPRVGLCPGSDGSGRADDSGGVTWVYVKQREGAADPRDDLRKVEALWKSLGITTERYRSGGDDPDLGVRGRGGPIETIDFLASTVGGYGIDAESQCADGDYGEMTGSGSTS